VYRHFRSLDQLHTAAVVQISSEAMDSQRDLMAEDLVAMVADNSDAEQLIHELARLSFAAGISDEAVDMTVLLAALADNPELAEAGRQADRAARATMRDVYRIVDERVEATLREGATHEDMAVMAFALNDGLVMWHQADPEAVPLEIDGPEGTSIKGPWDAFSLGIWAFFAHLRRPDDGENEITPD
jgi:AcrR family transcriptional regulator